MSESPTNPHAANLLARIEGRTARVGIIGLGYVGLPLALALCRAGFPVLGFDIDQRRVALLNRGESGIRHIASDALQEALAENRFEATADFARLGEADAVLICVPTPLTRQREPDLAFVERASRQIAEALRPGQLVVLESTTWPGTTLEVVKPILERGGERSGETFFLAFSPEREDPGNPDYGTRDIPKIVGGDGAHALQLAVALYGAAMASTVPVSSPSVAEAVKLTENIFRSVNIALVNELKVVYDAMGIDVWDVIAAAATKPFGFMPFQPGPGLGGHCIPIDPFYLAWKAREFEVPTRFIELAGEINTAMPRHVVDRLAEALDRRFRRGLNGAHVLVLGVAYKRNVEDTRESASFRLIEILEDRGARTSYHDPHVPEIGPTREHVQLAGRRSVDLTPEALAGFDAVLVATDHDDVDYALVAQHMRLGLDTRNAFAKRGLDLARVVKA
ncbi:nucleotide sugar dehydrogenase [Aureimonas jatrophae]|uniref:UDP-N-acetyl-D-glucosamine dehydrogenase n=1 Tax=Aureimonas jatrophae TaxID=1166073 RepID=A0A1H0EVV3_9HYPH|nr:nucleotide sugar dehydrogenase [Aureimonas jatrophae]MBB3950291.1 UDP-N-acetyl-D-glucosamine dehydrogenase [Aureimonas jatrophae]SDN86485.1 UDP-N-acetyl-D-glucosamine dehydrogenase [Aureimonas jatrophae]